MDAPVLFLLSRLCLDGVELGAKAGQLTYRGPSIALGTNVLAEMRQHKTALLHLVDGSTCRWCRGRIDWRGMPGTVALADGTSVHPWCRDAFEHDRIARSTRRHDVVRLGHAADPSLAVALNQAA